MSNVKKCRTEMSEYTKCTLIKKEKEKEQIDWEKCGETKELEEERGREGARMLITTFLTQKRAQRSLKIRDHPSYLPSFCFLLFFILR